MFQSPFRDCNNPVLFVKLNNDLTSLFFMKIFHENKNFPVKTPIKTSKGLGIFTRDIPNKIQPIKPF